MTEDAHPVHGRAAEFTRDLWTFLAAISAVEDEFERARLTATSLPSLLPCQLSGLAILNEAEGAWHVALQRDGHPIESPLADELLVDLVPLAKEAFRRPRLWSVSVEGPGFGVRSLTVAPLRTLDRRFGAIFVGRTSGADLSQLDESILLTLASHLSTGFENIRLYGKLQHHAENLQNVVNERTERLRKAEERRRVLLEINNVIIANLDRRPLFVAVAKSLQHVLRFDVASLALREPGVEALHVYELDSSQPAAEPVPVREIRKVDGYLEDVFVRRRPLLRRDLRQTHEGESEKSLLEAGLKAYVAVPLIKHAEPFGSLMIASRTAGEYSDADAEFLADVGQQVAFAVDNMLAYEEIGSLKARLEQENLYLHEEIETHHNFGEIVGESPAIKRALKAVETVATTDATVVIFGETGTGKELIARAVHSLSSRSTKTLIKVNCASISKGLFESEFFGHVRGAFTGALKDRAGRFELADKGTLFLDEVGEIPLDMQSKLLRVLQEGEVERVGGERTKRVDVRIVAATNRDLKQEVEAGRFRQDLYYRLSVFPIEVAPLRDRPEDIPLLVANFLRRTARKLNRPNPVVTQDGLQQLLDYHWPGNVRELQNTIERAMIISAGGPLQFDIKDQPRAPGRSEHIRDQQERRRGESTSEDAEIIPEAEWREKEQENILAALRKAGWQISGRNGAATLLGVNPATLASRIKKLGLKRGS